MPLFVTSKASTGKLAVFLTTLLLSGVLTSSFEDAAKFQPLDKVNSDDYSKPSPTKQKLDQVAKTAKEHHPFIGYNVPSIHSYKQAASYNAVPAIKNHKMKLSTNVSVAGIGQISNCYTWIAKPSIEAMPPDTIKGASVYLPENLKARQFNQMRQIAQEGVVTRKGITSEVAQQFALTLGGVVIEATLPYKAQALLQDRGPDVDIHCIFQTGLNFAGLTGGGFPLSDHKAAEGKIREYSAENTEAALNSAIRNKSDVLIFNLGIGTGFFAGKYGDKVKSENIDGICKAIENSRKHGKLIEVIVPNVKLTQEQTEQLIGAGIRIIPADKDAVAVLCARMGFRVSLTIAADPMSMLGIHGPGLWWETVGSASDEERAAFLTPCYALSYIPIDVHEANGTSQRIAALSEYTLN